MILAVVIVIVIDARLTCKAPTYKGGPNFGMAVNVREKFNLKAVLLCFGATSHMSGS